MTTFASTDDAASALAAANARRDATVLPTYGQASGAFTRGEGTALFDQLGRPHLDFLSGLAVTSLGHCHPAVSAAVSKQMDTLVHTSNLFITEPALELAERLRDVVGWPDAKAFFCQCGATANEAALKLARRHGLDQRPDKFRVVTLEGSFHGRSMMTLEATGQPAKHARFAPLAGWVDTVPHDDAEALRAAVTDETCAVLLEIVQGEGGVREIAPDVLQAAREACDAFGALLIVDEVQTGIGRTGTWFAFQQTEVVPDVVTVAKALANGLPIGAVLARGAAAEAFAPGDHATTFGGNPVTSAAACAVLATIEADDVLGNVAAREAQFRAGVDELADRHPDLVVGVRGRGLLLALVLARDVAGLLEAALRERFVITNAVAPGALRLAPPLTVTKAEMQLALSALDDALTAIATEEHA